MRAAQSARQNSIDLMHETVNEIFARLHSDDYKALMQTLSAKGIAESIVASVLMLGLPT